jgi:hypothetical protein
MSILAVLEVTVGVIFAWLGLSLAVMYVQEWVVGKLGWRSSMLETYLTNLLTDPVIAKQFYNHPLIQGLHSGPDGAKRPAYIPSGQFSTALFDIIRDAPKEAALIQKTLYDLQNDIDRLSKNKRELARQQLNLTLNLTRKALETEAGQEVVDAILAEAKGRIRKLSADYPALQPVIEIKFKEFASQKKQIDAILATVQAQPGLEPEGTTLDQIRLGLAVMSVSQPQLKRAIEALLTGVEEYVAEGKSTYLQARENLEEWFDNGMERLSGWYKRRSQTMAFIIGTCIAVFLNVDSLQLANQLWRDPIVRESLANQAAAFLEKNQDDLLSADYQQLAQLQIQISQLNVPVGWVGSALPVDSYGAVLIGDGTQKLCTFTPRSSVDLFGLRLGSECYPIANTPKFNDPTGWLLKIIGLLISGIAAAQGAPFWFDLLKNIIKIRSSGSNPSETPQKTTK